MSETDLEHQAERRAYWRSEADRLSAEKMDLEDEVARLREREAQGRKELGDALYEMRERAEKAETSERLADERYFAEVARVAELERDLEDWKAQAHVWNAHEARDRAEAAEARVADYEQRRADVNNDRANLTARVARLEEALREIEEHTYSVHAAIDAVAWAKGRARRALAHEEEGKTWRGVERVKEGHWQAVTHEEEA